MLLPDLFFQEADFVTNITIQRNTITAERGGIQIGFYLSGTPTYPGMLSFSCPRCVESQFALSTGKMRRAACTLPESTLADRSAAQERIVNLTACLLAGAYPNHATLTISNNVLNGSSFTPLVVWLINHSCCFCSHPNMMCCPELAIMRPYIV